MRIAGIEILDEDGQYVAIRTCDVPEGVERSGYGREISFTNPFPYGKGPDSGEGNRLTADNDGSMPCFVRRSDLEAREDSTYGEYSP